MDIRVQSHEIRRVGGSTFYENDIAERTLALFDKNNTIVYDEQFAEMKKIADAIGAEVSVGEVSFTKKWGKSINTIEQAKNSRKNRELGTTSYIWPGCQILKYP